MADLNEYIDEVQEKIGYRFKNIDLLHQAFTRSSYSAQYGGENNEALEFIGDSVLSYYVVKIVSDRFGFLKEDSDYYDKEDMNEYCIVARKDNENFTNLKQSIVSNKALAKRIDELEFAQYLYMGDGDIRNNVEKILKVKADLFEAILGAVAIDCNWNSEILENTVDFMLQIDDFLDDVDDTEERPAKYRIENAVMTLKELADKNKYYSLTYHIPDETIKQDGKYWWPCTVLFGRYRKGIYKVALGRSKKDAKDYAAYLVLCSYYGMPNEVFDPFKYNIVDYGRWGYCSPPGVGIPVELH